MLTYLLEITLVWGAFSLIYSLLLRRETFFQANRFYLLLAAAAGLALPFFTAGVVASQPASAAPAILLPEIAVGMERLELASEAVRTSSWSATILSIYYIGVVVAAGRLLVGLWQIFSLAARSRFEVLPDGTRLFHTDSVHLPFSFFQWIFVGRGFENESEAAQMFAHEQAHVHGSHSADVLFFEILTVAFWFHPLAHWFKKAARSVHEYLADAEASATSNRKQYGLLLIRQSQSGTALALANHFFPSQLKNRIIMLTTKTSAPVRGLKYGLVLPLFPLFVLLFQQNLAFAQVGVEIIENSEKVRAIEANNWQSLKADTVITINPETYEKQTKIIRMDYSPKPNEKGELVYSICEIQPQFPGEEAALIKFLSENIKYPEEAKKKGVQKRIIVHFVVNQTGQVTGIDEAVNPDFSPEEKLLFQEAIRVVKLLPNFKPGIHKGKPVSVKYTLPVIFRLK